MTIKKGLRGRAVAQVKPASIRITTAFLLTLLSGCATLRGSQDSLAELNPTDLIASTVAIKNFHKPLDIDREGMSRTDYRDYVVSTYLVAIEARYKSFVDQLQSSDRGTALGFDLLQLGLSGATALAGKSAINELAIIGTTTAGARASVDKRVFFERSLPALIASMDAERASIKADIVRKKKLPGETYGIGEAVDDLERLIEAGRIDRALARITSSAQADRAAEQARLDSITAACDDINVQDAALTADFRKFVEAKPENAAAAALELKVTVPPGAASRPLLMNAFATKLCGNTAKQDLLTKLQINAGP